MSPEPNDLPKTPAADCPAPLAETAPARPPGELSDEQLVQVAGGMRKAGGDPTSAGAFEIKDLS